MRPLRLAILMPAVWLAALGVAQAGPMVKLVAAPMTIQLCTGVSWKFQAVGLDSKGRIVPVKGPIKWSADPRAGKVTALGLFTAGSKPGAYRNAVTASARGLKARATVEVFKRSVEGGYVLQSVLTGDAAPGWFGMPWGLAVGPGDTLCVTDLDSNHVYRFDPSGKLVTGWGSEGVGPGQFKGSIGIAADPKGNVYVAEMTNRIQKFDSNGKFITQWRLAGATNPQVSRLNGIAVDRSGNVYVADGQTHSVQKFDSSGKYLDQWDSYGEGEKLGFLSGIAVDNSGQVYVLDRGLVKFDSTGKFIKRFEATIDSETDFEDMHSVAVDAGGKIYAVSPDNEALVIDPSGKLISKWTVGGGQKASSQLSCWAVTVDGRGNLYAADALGKRIWKYAPAK